MGPSGKRVAKGRRTDRLRPPALLLTGRFGRSPVYFETPFADGAWRSLVLTTWDRQLAQRTRERADKPREGT